MKPELTKEISIDDFRNYYWLKEELQSFCRSKGISATGSKGEITERIETYLLTGEIVKPVRKTRSQLQDVDFRLDTVIVEGQRCSQNLRYFFQGIIPNFHFSTYIQNFMKENVGKTLQDVVDAWFEEEERKKDPNYKREIGAQFEYNRFFRDYFADPNNKGKSRQDAIDMWNEIKNQKGNRKYIPS